MRNGRLVTLSALEEGDFELLSDWFEPVLGHALAMGSYEFETVDAMKRYFGSGGANCVMVKAKLATNKKIGLVSWQKQGYEGSYDIGAIIGDPELWDRGHGAEATLLLMHHLFHDKNAHRVQFTTGVHNRRIVRMLLKVVSKGQAVLEGVLRDYYFVDGAYHAAIVVSILRDEYYAHLRDGEYEDAVPEVEKEEARRQLHRYVAGSWRNDLIQRLVT